MFAPHLQKAIPKALAVSLVALSGCLPADDRAPGAESAGKALLTAHENTGMAQPTSPKSDRSAEPDSLDNLLSSLASRADYPALAAAVVREGRVVALGAVVVRKSGDPTPVTSEDAFHLGSCTKAITAALVAMLIEEGKLRWDSTLADIFPDLRQTMHPAYRSVTIDQLLAHRSGLPPETGVTEKSLIDLCDLPGTLREQRARYLSLMLARPPETTPGTQFIYSNGGYVVLGAILERVADTPWETLIQERIFIPLHMSTAGFGPMGTPDGVNQPWQHKVADGKLVPVLPEPQNDNRPALGPAGLVHCSMGDWAAFLIALMKDRRDGGLLQPATLKRLLTPQFGWDYAGGWCVQEKESKDGPTLHHSGSNGMNFCFAVIIPERQAAVLTATNRGGDMEALQVLARVSGEWASMLFAKYPLDATGPGGSAGP